MADYTVIADVGRSIMKLLGEQMTPEPIARPELIGLCSPAEKGDVNLSIFLYNIRELGYLRQTELFGSGATPPLAVELYYLFTAHSTAELQMRAIDEHRIMGRLMQVMYDHAILRNSYLQGALAGQREELRFVLHELPTEDMSKLWTFPNTPYKLSVIYSVGPVYIDSRRDGAAPRVFQQEFGDI
ncbi:DUF4255 domain-containing protein [Brevibacillus humidisoli]|uniref:DUF4255 domain-containing protein n=1 Tax=Brevibacillus humidisoli TaxID=2895522 RepID=UPI001E5E3D67|nr:DUF4255 domain-containing protein [Brevibacillus humidisoli]UFJ38958.1 DUF4255 domain-containing protein [Brevibacillus humidisoli]